MTRFFGHLARRFLSLHCLDGVIWSVSFVSEMWVRSESKLEATEVRRTAGAADLVWRASLVIRVKCAGPDDVDV